MCICVPVSVPLCAHTSPCPCFPGLRWRLLHGKRVRVCVHQRGRWPDGTANHPRWRLPVRGAHEQCHLREYLCSISSTTITTNITTTTNVNTPIPTGSGSSTLTATTCHRIGTLYYCTPRTETRSATIAGKIVQGLSKHRAVQGAHYRRLTSLLLQLLHLRPSRVERVLPVGEGIGHDGTAAPACPVGAGGLERLGYGRWWRKGDVRPIFPLVLRWVGWIVCCRLVAELGHGLFPGHRVRASG